MTRPVPVRFDPYQLSCIIGKEYNKNISGVYVGLYSPRDEPLLIMCLGAKGLRVVSKSGFCADFKK